MIGNRIPVEIVLKHMVPNFDIKSIISFAHVCKYHYKELIENFTGLRSRHVDLCPETNFLRFIDECRSFYLLNEFYSELNKFDHKLNSVIRLLEFINPRQGRLLLKLLFIREKEKSPIYSIFGNLLSTKELSQLTCSKYIDLKKTLDEELSKRYRNASVISRFWAMYMLSRVLVCFIHMTFTLLLWSICTSLSLAYAIVLSITAPLFSASLVDTISNPIYTKLSIWLIYTQWGPDPQNPKIMEPVAQDFVGEGVGAAISLVTFLSIILGKIVNGAVWEVGCANELLWSCTMVLYIAIFTINWKKSPVTVSFPDPFRKTISSHIEYFRKSFL